MPGHTQILGTILPTMSLPCLLGYGLPSHLCNMPAACVAAQLTEPKRKILCEGPKNT